MLRNRIIEMVILVFAVACLSACHNYNKNEIIEPFKEYEEYVLAEMNGDIAITGVAYEENEFVTFTIVLLNEDYEHRFETIARYLECSDAFLDKNPNCVLNDQYRIVYNFSTAYNSNGSPGDDICSFSNVTDASNVNDHVCSVRFDYYDESAFQYFDFITEANCCYWSDAEIDSIISAYSNLDTVFVESEDRVNDISSDHPEVSFVSVR